MLRKNIVDGIYPEGSLLPSENELCKVHSITRPTVRQALTALVNDGFISKQKGKGSIVRSTPKNIGILSIQSTTMAVGDKALKTRIVVKPEIIPWPEKFVFEVPEEFKAVGCIYFERIRLVDDLPIFYDITFMPNINLPRFSSRNLENKSLFDVLRSQYEIEVTGGQQRLSAIKATKIIAPHLQVKTGHPLLHMERQIETNRYGFHFYSFIYCNTSDFALSGSF